MTPSLPRLAQRLLGLAAGRCPACGLGESPELCADCARELAPRTGGYCPRCGALVPDADAPARLCGDCRVVPRPWDAFAFHGEYAGLLRLLILRYKFQGGLGLGRLLEGFMADALQRHLGDKPAPELITPVPLHASRLRGRGYNQSLELCRALAKRRHIPIELQALRRTRATQQQYRLNIRQRRENIKGAFAADPSLVGGRRALLVDDVMTSGATLEECARALRRAGAAWVGVLVLARTAEG